ncbi:MAG: AbrB/MazE/SpoVT family DNA-binding domain-containing protein [Thermoanaerobaculia bacterium]|jgi:AbrB family looped-hinge helix DNA binding protein
MIATVTSKGQVTLPAEARKQLGIKAGSKLEFIVVDGTRLEVIPVAQSVTSLKSILPKPKKRLSLGEIDDAIGRGGAGK